MYTYSSSGELRQHLEIEAHIGGVNDIAFAYPNKQLCVVTCGDDRLIKVWDAIAGRRQYTFEGHGAPVYSVCPHYKESIQFIFSTAIDGKIKAWLFDCMGSRVDYDAPGLWCTTMVYSADGTRLFSCGTSKEGESYLVEWNESEGTIKRMYTGFKKRSLGVVQFDTTRNRFLAAGDEFQIKFWEMDSINMVAFTDADGGLPASPRLRFNKEGSLLAVTTIDNGIKILANNDGQSVLEMFENRQLEGTRGLSEVANIKAIAPMLERAERIQQSMSIGNPATIESSMLSDAKPRTVDNADKAKSWKFPDITDSSKLKSLKLPDPLTASKVVRLLYTSTGLMLLALCSNGVHKLWRWPQSERNPSGKSSASIVPLLWQPNSGALMSNDLSDVKLVEERASCIALSKNDSYVMSASGGKVSLFNMMSSKVMKTFMPPPPAATYLAFHPQDNNVIAVGMEDSTIHIYNARVDKLNIKLKGHQKRITGLAFSQSLNVLISSGADAQLCIWNMDGWEKKKSRVIQAAPGHPTPPVGETRVQFRNDQSHILVVHESQISIYDTQLESMRSWYPRDSLAASISSATYSCDGTLVLAGFSDGAIGIFDADSLGLRCQIASSAYISTSIGSSGTYPVVIAAHPEDPYQFALGMSDGTVYVIEPSDAEPKWGRSSQDNGSLLSIHSSSALNSQPCETPR
ncbi:unnamed protein product [Cuscuta campestris]|uniref:IFT140 first beta-propeller domain-containing protein n=1 Tax=Cuscuta campestris TaxID=132261 RepID=A0A484L3H9_9ASTE|nr:unnamed protein product [Cuscuta campestris]